MISSIGTVSFQGVQAIPIIVQVQIVGGSLPSFSLVGLPDKAVNESRERIRAALYTLGIALPPKRITMNLSPANLQKEGNHYDLPLALCLMIALEILPEELSHALALGELGLDGSIKPVRGALSAAMLATELKKRLICPEACGSEAAWGGNQDILAPATLLQVVNHFKGIQMLSPPEGKMGPQRLQYKDFSEIRGQEVPKRVMTIAAAGRHNVLMIGPPGTGKSTLSSCFRGILPELSALEALEVTIIHSLASSRKEAHLIRERPFRNPHHSVSVAALVGGGLKGLPGEISLAHNGVLFLDELAEFPRHALESLRQSLESGEAIVARANYRSVFPARFQLIAAMNPCRCGYLGHPNRQCHKAPLCGQQYRQNLSGPLLDRIDMSVSVPDLTLDDLSQARGKEESPYLLAAIKRAYEVQEARYRTLLPGAMPKANAYAPQESLDQELAKNSEVKTLLIRAVEKFYLSARSYYRILRVARTIADLEGSENLSRHHLSEALSYRLESL
jgi:magnesium chelatase family protein